MYYIYVGVLKNLAYPVLKLSRRFNSLCYLNNVTVNIDNRACIAFNICKLLGKLITPAISWGLWVLGTKEYHFSCQSVWESRLIGGCTLVLQPVIWLYNLDVSTCTDIPDEKMCVLKTARPKCKLLWRS